MNRHRITAAALAVVLATGCGEGGATAREAGVAVDTIGGIETLTYDAASPGLLPWALDTVAVLGDAFADDAYQFNNVNPGGLAADAAGNLYVLDAQGGRVLAYDPAGAHLATYGRPGEGPGELQQPLGLDVGPGDTVWVTDFSNSRLTGYPTTAGEPRTLPFPENSGIPSSRIAALDDGFLVLFRPIFAFRRGSGGAMQMSRPGGDDSAAVQSLPLVRLDRSFQPTDTIWRTPEPPMDMVQIDTGERMFMTLMSREFWPEFQWAPFSDGGVVVSDSVGYVLQLVDASGSVTRVLRRGPPPRATTDADREAARQRVRDEAENETGVRIGGSGPSDDMRRRMLEQRLEKMTFADVIPRVLRVAVDPRDRIWVGVSEDTPDEIERIDLYDRDGRLLGEMREVPFPDVFLDEERVGVLRRDELDVQQVVVLTVGEAAG